LPLLEGFAWELAIFCPKKRVPRNLRKFFTIKAKDGRGAFQKNVLTEKKALFLGVLAGKPGFPKKKIAL